MDDTNYRLKRVILKPTARCTANCIGCALRRSYYKSLSERRTLSISEWRTVLHDARSIGAESLVISGGEPTLYDHLHDLIYEASSLGFHVTLNTNGSAIDPQYAEHLIQTGLKGVLISLYSDKPEIHNTIRRNPRLWRQACESIRMYARFKPKYQGFRLRTQLIILRENYRTLDEIVRFHMSLGSDEVVVSYLEGDFERKNILTAEENRHLREAIIPKLIRLSKSFRGRARLISRRNLQRILDTDYGSPEDFGKGIYWKKNHCDLPKWSTLLLANGDIHPCNMVEYSHYPIMGNLLENSLPEIWKSQKWNRFRKERFDKCLLCPMNLHFSIPLQHSPTTWDPLNRLTDIVRYYEAIDLLRRMKLRIYGPKPLPFPRRKRME